MQGGTRRRLQAATGRDRGGQRVPRGRYLRRHDPTPVHQRRARDSAALTGAIIDNTNAYSHRFVERKPGVLQRHDRRGRGLLEGALGRPGDDPLATPAPRSPPPRHRPRARAHAKQSTSAVSHRPRLPSTRDYSARSSLATSAPARWPRTAWRSSISRPERSSVKSPRAGGVRARSRSTRSRTSSMSRRYRPDPTTTRRSWCSTARPARSLIASRPVPAPRPWRSTRRRIGCTSRAKPGSTPTKRSS